MLRNLGLAIALFGVLALVGYSGVMASGSQLGQVISPDEAREIHGGVAACFNVTPYYCTNVPQYSCYLGNPPVPYVCYAQSGLYSLGSPNPQGYQESPTATYYCCGAGNYACNVYPNAVVACQSTITITTIVPE